MFNFVILWLIYCFVQEYVPGKSTQVNPVTFMIIIQPFTPVARHSNLYPSFYSTAHQPDLCNYRKRDHAVYEKMQKLHLWAEWAELSFCVCFEVTHFLSEVTHSQHVNEMKATKYFKCCRLIAALCWHTVTLFWRKGFTACFTDIFCSPLPWWHLSCKRRCASINFRSVRNLWLMMQ